MGAKQNVWRLVECLVEEANTFKSELNLVRAGQTTRVQSKKYILAQKSINTAFAKFEENNNLRYLLRFAANQADKVAIAPLEDIEYEKEDDE